MEQNKIINWSILENERRWVFKIPLRDSFLKRIKNYIFQKLKNHENFQKEKEN